MCVWFSMHILFSVKSGDILRRTLFVSHREKGFFEIIYADGKCNRDLERNT